MCWGEGHQQLSGCLLWVPEIMVGQAVTDLGLLTSVGMMELWEAMRLKEK